MLSKENRISGRQLTEKLLKKGKEYKSRYLIFRFLPSVKPVSEFCIIVSAKTSPLAVVRNRIKRQISESLRLNIGNLKTNLASVIIAKKSAATAPFSALDEEIKKFCNQF